MVLMGYPRFHGVSAAMRTNAYSHVLHHGATCASNRHTRPLFLCYT